LIAPHLLVDATFLRANLFKIIEGRPGCAALAGVRDGDPDHRGGGGSKLLFDKTAGRRRRLDDLVGLCWRRSLPARDRHRRVLTSDPVSAPTALMHSLKHYKVLHERTSFSPSRPTTGRACRRRNTGRIEPVGADFFPGDAAVRLHGAAECVPQALGIARKLGWQFDIMSTSFFGVAPQTAPGRAFKHAAVAGPPVHFAGARRNDAHGLFPDSRGVAWSRWGTQVTI